MDMMVSFYSYLYHRQPQTHPFQHTYKKGGGITLIPKSFFYSYFNVSFFQIKKEKKTIIIIIKLKEKKIKNNKINWLHRNQI